MGSGQQHPERQEHRRHRIHDGPDREIEKREIHRGLQDNPAPPPPASVPPLVRAGHDEFAVPDEPEPFYQTPLIPAATVGSLGVVLGDVSLRGGIPITFLSVILVPFLIDLWNAIMIARCNDILLYSYPRIRYATRDTPRTRYIATGGIEEIMVRILY